MRLASVIAAASICSGSGTVSLTWRDHSSQCAHVEDVFGPIAKRRRLHCGSRFSELSRKQVGSRKRTAAVAAQPRPWSSALIVTAANAYSTAGLCWPSSVNMSDKF
jgi:hypothetical protein